MLAPSCISLVNLHFSSGKGISKRWREERDALSLQLAVRAMGADARRGAALTQLCPTGSYITPFLQIKGESYRPKQKRRVGVITKANPESKVEHY